MDYFSTNGGIDETKREEVTHDHECTSCKRGFDSGFGSQFDLEKYCVHCIENGNHIADWKAGGLTPFEIQETKAIEEKL